MDPFKTPSWAQATAVLATLAAFGWAAYTGVVLFMAASATVKLGVLTAAVSVLTIIYNNSRQQVREIKARQFAEKSQAYRKFFDFMFDIFAFQRRGAAMEETEMIDRMHVIMKELMIWGSAETINQYNQFIRLSASSAAECSPRIFQNVEDLMRSLRRDLGHDDNKLERLGLSKLLIKGEEHDQLGL
jgi:hypothetical protein